LGAAVPCAWANYGYSIVVIGDGPMGYWRLGESQTTPFAADVSGNTPSHNGVYSRGILSGVAGAIIGDPDTAATFNGASGYIDVGGAGAFDLLMSFTLEAWVINNGQTDSPYASRILSTRSGSGGYGFGLQNAPNDPNPNALIFTTFAIKDYYSTAAVVPEDGQWHHVVVVFDSTLTANFYLDGNLADSIPPDAGNGPVNPSPFDLNIGRNPIVDGGGFSEYFNGNIDEVAVYNYELTAAQIMSHYTMGTSP
jgi:hypothetical protein